MAPKVHVSTIQPNEDGNFSTVTHGFRPGQARPGEPQPDTFRETLNPWMTVSGPTAFSHVTDKESEI